MPTSSWCMTTIMYLITPYNTMVQEEFAGASDAAGLDKRLGCTS